MVSGSQRIVEDEVDDQGGDEGVLELVAGGGEAGENGIEQQAKADGFQ